ARSAEASSTALALIARFTTTVSDELVGHAFAARRVFPNDILCQAKPCVARKDAQLVPLEMNEQLVSGRSAPAVQNLAWKKDATRFVEHRLGRRGASCAGRIPNADHSD